MRKVSAACLWGLLAALVVLSLSAATAAPLRLTPLLDSQSDLVRVVPTREGGAALLQERGIDLIRPDGARVSLVRTGEAQRAILAEGGRFYGVITHRDGAADFAPTQSFELRSVDGALVWSMGPTEDVTYAVSSGGAVVGLSMNINVPQRGTLHFYGPGGVLNATETFPGLTGGRFDAEGRVFIAESATLGLRAFDPIGTPLWNVDDALMFAITPGGEETAVLRHGQIRLMRGAVMVAVVPVESDFIVRRIAIAPDGSRIAIAGRDEIRVYDSTLAPTATMKIDDTAYGYTSIDVASTNGWILAGLARDLGPGVSADVRHPDGEVRAYDASGRLAHVATLRFDAWNIFTPTAVLDPDGHAATITTRRSIYRTVLP
jgi:hypothetical protein